MPLVHSDCRDYIPRLKDNSIHGICTDPPYEMNFMGAEWDSTGIAFDVDTWTKLKQKLTPGAHVLGFGFPTNFDMLVTALRFAGFEIRDVITWHYGSGMPKGLHIGKKIDRDLGIKSERPVSPLAHYFWDYHTLLKPSTEFIVLARKPPEQGLTEVENMKKWGTGALNIGATRIAVNPSIDDLRRKVVRQPRISQTWEVGSGFKNEDNQYTGVLPEGRFPNNTIIQHHEDCVLVEKGTEVEINMRERSVEFKDRSDIYSFEKRSPIETCYPDPTEVWACVPSCPVRRIDEQAGFRYASTSITGEEPSCKSRDGIYEKFPDRSPFKAYGDNGFVSRFFYCPKASASERNAGLPEGFSNNHLSVKPMRLIRWLLRLILRPTQSVLDQFSGSGTTWISASLEKLKFYGCELDHKNVQIANLRYKYWVNGNDSG